MVTVLLAPGGHKKVMQAFDYFRAVMKERTRFQLLMSALVQEPVDPAFQVSTAALVAVTVCLIIPYHGQEGCVDRIHCGNCSMRILANGNVA